MLKRTFSLTIGAILVVVCVIETGTTISEAASTAEPPLTPPEHSSIHQKASTCWENFEAQFEDEPQDCQNVCESCHIFATVIGGKDNPEAYTTDVIFPEALDEEANWNTIGLLQRSCRNCHTEITEAEPGLNHEIFVEYEAGDWQQNFKETSLKLFDKYVLCTTCHSPHREEIALLRISNQGSTLCLDCHST
jgi:predicted CXXCH cytochrome family protein